MDGFDWDAPRPEYPWQQKLPPWAPKAHLTEAERRADLARFLFGFEKGWIEDGMCCVPGLAYDAEADLFRFPDGRFVLNLTHVIPSSRALRCPRRLRYSTSLPRRVPRWVSRRH